MCTMMHLWINLMDLDSVGRVGAFGSPLNLMIRKDLGDELLPGAYYKPSGNLDDNYVVVKTTDDRAEAIGGALELIGKKKIGRKIRMRTTVNPPGKAWRWVG
jgi:hypothetical protein